MFESVQVSQDTTTRRNRGKVYYLQ